MPLIDEALLTEYQNDIGAEKAATLLKIVISEMEMRSKNAFQAYESDDKEKMAREFHTVKSICFMVGATDMGNLAMDIEVNGSEMTTDNMTQKLEQYANVKEKTIEYLNQRLAS